MARLSLDQAPPLAIPTAFFVSAPLAVVGAGVLLLTTGNVALQSSWVPHTLALTHLGTLGFLSMVMLGALYQMTPVVAGATVPAIRLAHVVHALLVVGVICLTLHLTGAWGGTAFIPFAIIALAMVLFLTTVGFALATTKTRGETVAGMRFALLCLLALGTVGILMARGFYDAAFPGPRPLWIQVHLSVALLGWVGGLITAVSWQVVPMFYLTSPIPRFQKRLVFSLLSLGVTLPIAVLLMNVCSWIASPLWEPKTLAAIGTIPAVASVWLIHPHLTFYTLKKRRRKRLDASLHFWQVALLVAPLTAGAAVGTFLSHDPRWGLLLGWLAIWGWAGMIVHGMLSRIFPFLIWFHRFSHYVGKLPVPPMRRLLPDRWTRLGLGLHCASLLVGLAAIATRNPWLAELTGLLLVGTGLNMLGWMVHLLRQFPDLSPLRAEAP